MSTWLVIALVACGWALLWCVIGWFLHQFEEHVHRNDPTYPNRK